MIFIYLFIIFFWQNDPATRDLCVSEMMQMEFDGTVVQTESGVFFDGTTPNVAISSSAPLPAEQ
jgi:hypothetical protein